MRKLYIKTFGCQMNIYDSDRIKSIFNEMGFESTENANDADVAIINTCSVREKPQHKVESELGRLKSIWDKNKDFKIGVCGCVAQQEGQRFLDNFKQVSFVFGTDAIQRLHDIFDLVENGQRICDVTFNKDGLSIPVFSRDGGVSAFVTIMKGCDNFCSYCIVPYVRGREKSRQPNEIIEEIKFLIDKGVKEITLLGQNVNSYGKNLDEIDNFPKLLHMVNDIDGLERIRFVTSHPKDFSGELIDAVSELDKVCEYLHLPLQAGSDSVLKSMNRKYTYGEYRDKILKAKDKISNLSLSSDFIVGFPGETDKDFEQTLTALKEIEYETLFAFKYSVRPGTKAENLDDDVPEKVKSERLTELLKLQYEISEKIQKKYIDTSLEVLVEGMSKKDNKVYMGRSRQNRIVNFESDISLNNGDIVNVNITEAKKNTLYGILEKV